LEDTVEVELDGTGVDSGGGAWVEVNGRREGCSYLARRIHGTKRLGAVGFDFFLLKFTIPDIERIFAPGAIRFQCFVDQTNIKQEWSGSVPVCSGTKHTGMSKKNLDIGPSLEATTRARA
jgi:hypothetical protein